MQRQRLPLHYETPTGTDPLRLRLVGFAAVGVIAVATALIAFGILLTYLRHGWLTE